MAEEGVEPALFSGLLGVGGGAVPGRTGRLGGTLLFGGVLLRLVACVGVLFFDL